MHGGAYVFIHTELQSNKGETKMPIMKKMRRINIIGAQRSHEEDRNSKTYQCVCRNMVM